LYFLFLLFDFQGSSAALADSLTIIALHFPFVNPFLKVFSGLWKSMLGASHFASFFTNAPNSLKKKLVFDPKTPFIEGKITEIS